MNSAFRRVFALLVLIAAAAPARADWHVARSKHFIIYANERAERLRSYAEKLEKLDKAVRLVRDMRDPPVGDGNRLTIFVLPNDVAVQRLLKDKSGMVRGAYLPRASGSIAFVPRRAEAGEQDFAETILLHEYAHHLMLHESNAAYPEWLVEGFAEFMSTARIGKDGSVLLGTPPLHRARGLLSGNPLPLQTLVSGDYGKLADQQREALYGRGWLLAHYLTFEPSRRGQLERYVDAITKGTKPLDAAVAAFGDLKQLEKETEAYLRRPRMMSVEIASRALSIGPVEVAPLSAGAAAVMPLRIESKRGVNRTTAGPLAQKVREVAAAYPADPLVLATLAEAEFDAGNYEAAQAAADRALALDKRNIEAMIYKGRAIVRRSAGASPDRSQRFSEARKLFVAANKLDTEDPEPLLEFYKSYQAQGIAPTANALSALHYASELAPQDLGLRMTSATAYLRAGKLAEARARLAPVAFHPHAGGLANSARRLVELIDSGKASAALGAIIQFLPLDPAVKPD